MLGRIGKEMIETFTEPRTGARTEARIQRPLCEQGSSLWLHTPIFASSESNDHDDDESGVGTATISKPKSQTKTPSLYRVILMNDDYTPMDFVIHVLQKFFHKDVTEATQIMLQVHHKGAGICGVFTYEIAETKVYQVNQYSKQNRHPLKCTMEKV